MMNISIEIKAPELASAIESLAAALTGKSVGIGQGVEAPRPQFAPASTPTGPQYSQQQPMNLPTAVPTAVPTAFQQQYQPQPAPIAQTQSAPVVPTTAPSYTMDQLAVAASHLMDDGKRADLEQLLAVFGVPALTALPVEQYGIFATKLREMGAKI